MKKHKITENINNKSVKVNKNTLRSLISRFASTSHDGKRDLYSVFGYDICPSIKEYASRYKRQDIAFRTINAYPEACWRNMPIVTDDLGDEDDTEFESQFKSISKTLKLQSISMKSDKVSSIGRYGVLFIGINDGIDTSLPVLERKYTVDDILFLSPYSEENASIDEFESDPMSSRFGMPKTYKLSTGGYSCSYGTTMPSNDLVVHWSRIIHIAENSLENDIFGIPRLEPILNRLVDLEKVVGGSAEIFWLNGRAGLHINAPIDSEIKDPEKMTEEIENYTHKLTRFLRTKGMEVNALDSNVSDPSNHFDILIKLISGATGIPSRILVGSERGELASSQDEHNWLSRVNERQLLFCEQTIIRPLIDWFINRKILPNPINNEYELKWNDFSTLSEIDKADIAIKRSSAIASYVNSPGAERIIPESQFVEEIIGIDFKQDMIDDSPDFDDLEEEPVENE